MTEGGKLPYRTEAAYWGWTIQLLQARFFTAVWKVKAWPPCLSVLLLVAGRSRSQFTSYTLNTLHCLESQMAMAGTHAWKCACKHTHTFSFKKIPAEDRVLGDKLKYAMVAANLNGKLLDFAFKEIVLKKRADPQRGSTQWRHHSVYSRQIFGPIKTPNKCFHVNVQQVLV